MAVLSYKPGNFTGFHLEQPSVVPPGGSLIARSGPSPKGMAGPGHACWLVEWLAVDRALSSLGLRFPSVAGFSESPPTPQRATHSVWRKAGLRGPGAASFLRCRALGRPPQACSCPKFACAHHPQKERGVRIQFSFPHPLEKHLQLPHCPGTSSPPPSSCCLCGEPCCHGMSPAGVCKLG